MQLELGCKLNLIRVKGPCRKFATEVRSEKARAANLNQFRNVGHKIGDQEVRVQKTEKGERNPIYL